MSLWRVYYPTSLLTTETRMGFFGNLWSRTKGIFAPKLTDDEIRQHLDKLKLQAPTPIFWLFGKTQSGKTSIVKQLTGAEKAEIGRGFAPCTRFSSLYVFPNAQTPLMQFLDTRGLDEPGYDPAEDLKAFANQAHVVLVVVKALDHGQQNVLASLKRIREANPKRPIVLALTCLHEAYPQQQHPLPYPFTADATLPADAPPLFAGLAASIAEQKTRFAGLVDRFVAIDLTPAEEGFNDPNYGGDVLKQALYEVLPAAESQALRTLIAAQKDLQDLFMSRATPTIIGYSTLAGTAGAVPIPVVDLLLLSAVQTQMVHELANLYGQPLTKQRFGELASALGLGILTHQASRALIKVIPGLGSLVGSVAGGALAAASTYALGKAFCYYYQAVLSGQELKTADLKRYYNEQLSAAQQAWKRLHSSKTPPTEKNA